MKADTSAEHARDALVDALLAQGRITSPAVEAAFRAVARERFMPAGTDLELAYGVDRPVVTKRGSDGTATSSISAAYIQARMLEHVQLQPGMRVLEVGSGGLNAALIAETMGAGGAVVSVDIDPDVTACATRLLRENGYGDRVQVLTADAAVPLPGAALFDAIIVTAAVADIVPAWLTQLSPHGRLSLPLVMNGVTRTIGWHRTPDHLASTASEYAGFVPLQGAARHADHTVTLTGSSHSSVTLVFDVDPPHDPSALEHALGDDPIEWWSPVTFPNGTSWADLYLWFACFLHGFCRITTDDTSTLLTRNAGWPFGCVTERGLAHLATRPAPDGQSVQFGARGYGPDGDQAATALLEQISAWDRHARHQPPPTFGYWPAPTDPALLPMGHAVMTRPNGFLTISWPPKG